MQENIRSYKRLEQEAASLQEKIALLDQIVKTHENYSDAQNRETLYSFLIDRASADTKNIELSSAQQNAQEQAEQLEILASKIEDNVKRLKEFRGQHVTLQTELMSDGAAQSLELINRQITEKEQKILSLQNEYEKTSSALAVHIAAWRNHLETMLHKITAAKQDSLKAAISSRISDINEEGAALYERINTLTNVDADTITQIGQTGLADISALADHLKTHAIELNSRLRDEQDFLAKQRAELVAEQQSLQSGVYPFPQDALDLKEAVISRLRNLPRSTTTCKYRLR
jgi:hypothetical protein